jgi:hypothetical protein
VRRALIISALVLGVLLSSVARADVIVPIWTAQAAASATFSRDTAGFREAQVTVGATPGTSPAGTVTIYVAATPTSPLISVSSYATPTAPKTFRGPVGGMIYVVLTGNSVGTVDAVLLLR